MLIGVHTTKGAVYFAETTGAAKKFVVTKIRRIEFQISASSDWANLLKDVGTILSHPVEGNPVPVAILKCSDGRFGSSLEAIKAEVLVELAAIQKNLPIIPVSPQSLRSALNCPSGVKWQERSKELFNSQGEHKYWIQGANGAAAAAFKAACSL